MGRLCAAVVKDLIFLRILWEIKLNGVRRGGQVKPGVDGSEKIRVHGLNLKLLRTVRRKPHGSGPCLISRVSAIGRPMMIGFIVELFPAFFGIGLDEGVFDRNLKIPIRKAG